MITRKTIKEMLWFGGFTIALHGAHIVDDDIHHRGDKPVGQRVMLVGVFGIVASAVVWGRTCRCSRCRVQVSEYDKRCWNCEIVFKEEETD